MGSGRVIVREVPYGQRRFIKRSSPVRTADSEGKRYRSIVRGFFWEVTRRRRELGAGSTRRAVPAFMRRHMAAGGSLWEAIPFYSAGGFLWESPPVRAEEGAGSTRPHTRRAAVSMRSGALRLGCNLHEKTPAPRGRELYAGRARPPVRAEEGAGSARRTESAFMPRLANTAGAGGLREAAAL